MYYINKITSNSVVDFAADELKKYLRMMMPEGGDVKIAYAPQSSDGFRLGLMQDFGLDVSDALDTDLDDIIYIDCNEFGGIIAGDNPRSVLLAVYEYLRQNGCRWLYPGVDGEYIPMKDIVPVKYRHKPSCRYRGQCNEGAEYQSDMLEAIEFTPKVGMNVFMVEFFLPRVYYKRYYEHQHNEENRPFEMITDDQILQWKRMCETEIARRGLQFHDIGHGWTAAPFGINTAACWDSVPDEVDEENRQYLAEIGGKRGMWNGQPLNTNFCMSNPVARKKYACHVADYAEKHSNSDYLHLWLADAFNNHCECSECQKKTTSDWYIMLMNDTDEELTRRSLDTRLVYIAYFDTAWAPQEATLKNPDRFTMLLAPITRSYTETLPESGLTSKPTEYIRNNIQRPRNLEEYFVLFEEWKKNWKGANMSYEYHFWRPQCFDLSGIVLAKRIYEDIHAYKKYDVNGIIEDGSQRSFFPNGFAFYTYARCLFDNATPFEAIAEDYYSHIYGEGWQEIYSYLENIASLVPYAYLHGARPKAPYAPELLENFKAVKESCLKMKEKMKSEYHSPVRVQTVSKMLLSYHSDFCILLCDALMEKCLGNDDEATELYNKFRVEFGKCEIAIERYYDHWLWMTYLKSNVFDRKAKQEKKDDSWH